MDVGGPSTIGYETHTGALLRINGSAQGAFDREHPTMVCDLPRDAQLSFEVELCALPTNGLPSGPGLRWWLMNLFASQRPARVATIAPANGSAESTDDDATYPLIGHSHLDVAWLWTYGEARRKAMRTFAIAVNLLDRFSQFRFAQSQPQLYEFVLEEDPDLFDRVRALAAEKRFDASVAALWVESDCNIPSGESLLRQMLFAHRFCVEHFGEAPEVAWLPDSFGFANTLPTLLSHAGIGYFVTTKLQWNDTTRFPYAQFRWRGPDGSDVISALIDSYDGGLNAWRMSRARERREPIVAGYGDGGGGVTEAMIERAQHVGRWTRPVDWLRGLAPETLPVHEDELYLEYHRGVFTTHHDVKRRNARIERLLTQAEDAVSCCVAVRHDASQIRAWLHDLDEAWTLLLRNQFHDVLPGTSIGAVYLDVHKEYDRAEDLIAEVLRTAYDVVPRPDIAERPAVVPSISNDAFFFRNGVVEARVLSDGVIEDLRLGDGKNVVTRANVLTLYRDRPRQWDAWNLDADYRAVSWRPRAGDARVARGALIVPVSFGRSHFEMHIRLREGEPFLRITLCGDWRERHTLLRCENTMALKSDTVMYGAPHGTIERAAVARTAQDRAKFEVPGQRFAFVHTTESGVAILALDTYGWNAQRDEAGLHLGHSLLRSPMWPHADADAGRQDLSYAIAPLANGPTGNLERLWSGFSEQQSSGLFACEDVAVVIAACKPAQDGDGVILRIRECEGEPNGARIRCMHPFVSVERVDGLERSLGRERCEDQTAIGVTMEPFELQSYRVRF